MKMGLALSRRLGPKDTWRVMQTLGELGAAPRLQNSSVLEALPVRTQEAVVGISRGQFLKGVGGAAVAASVLSSGALFPSVATAQTITSGTTEQRTLARSIVRNSRPFQALQEQQAKLGSNFDLSTAPVRVTLIDGKYRATVITNAPHQRVGATATFFLDLTERRLRSYRHIMRGNKPDATHGVRTTLTKYRDGLFVGKYYRTIFVGDKYVVTSDNRLLSPAQFKSELQQASSSNVATRSAATSASDPQFCQDQPAIEAWCDGAVDLGCQLGAAVLTSGASVLVRGIIYGGDANETLGEAACNAYIDYIGESSTGCPSFARTVCFDPWREPEPVSSREPSYYCR
jgi:hypothetical protein